MQCSGASAKIKFKIDACSSRTVCTLNLIVRTERASVFYFANVLFSLVPFRCVFVSAACSGCFPFLRLFLVRSTESTRGERWKTSSDFRFFFVGEFCMYVAFCFFGDLAV